MSRNVNKLSWECHTRRHKLSKNDNLTHKMELNVAIIHKTHEYFGGDTTHQKLGGGTPHITTDGDSLFRIRGA